MFVDLGAVFTLTDSSALANGTADYGSGVQTYGAPFYMNGGSITGRSASYGGGDVYNTGSFYMSGGSIYVDGNSDFSLSEAAVITGNRKISAEDNTSNNVYLASGKLITLSGDFSGSLGVTQGTAPSAGTQFGTNAGAHSGANRFFFDGGDLSGAAGAPDTLAWSAQCIAVSESAEHELVFAYYTNTDTDRSLIAAVYDASKCLQEIRIISSSEITNSGLVRTGITVKNSLTYMIFSLDPSSNAPSSDAAQLPYL